MKAKQKKEFEVHAFKTPRAFERWLGNNHDKVAGIWLQFFKIGSGVKSITYAEALDEALCFGWIDGQVKKYDEYSWIQKFTPRRARSIWSKRNTQHVERLIAEGRMKPAGMKQVEQAKGDSRWTQAYESPSKITVPEDFLKALSKFKRATAFYESLNKANKYAIAWRLHTAKKPETRKKRMKTIIDMLKRGEKFH